MSGYRDQIASFLRSKGLNDYAVAGFLGNFMVESGFDPTSQNTGEHAIGFANWEGGRRDALRQWALTHYGAQETDARSQLTFMWHELTTGYSGVLSQLQHVTSAGEAAAIIDSQYEVSSGEARQTRINYANQFYTGSGPNPTYSGSLASTSSSGESQLGGDMTKADFMGVDSLGDLLKSIPELSDLLNKAAKHDWTVTRFENEVENSHWYKHHSETARSVLIQQANDPATWHQTLRSTEQSINALARQLGMPLGNSESLAIAMHALMTGNDNNQQWLTSRISAHEDYSHVRNLDTLRGGMAATSTQLQQMAAEYGVRWTPAQIAEKAQKVLAGVTTIDTYQADLVSWAKSAFPALTAQLESGQTVKDLADPYVQSMSSLLEIDPGGLSVYTPKIRRAMQGVTDPKTKERTQINLSDFEDQVRHDSRWQYTQNAKDTVSSALLQLGADFGFGPEGS